MKSPALFSLVLLLATVTLVRSAESPATFKVSSVTFSRPTAWQWIVPASSMRKAQLEIPNPKGKDGAEVLFFHFGPGNGGGTRANIDRWFGQFQESRDQIQAKTEEIKIGTTKVTYVQGQGTYKSGMPGGPQVPKPGYALLGAIVEADGGHIFARMTGPKDQVTSLTADFKKMIESGLAK